MDVAPAVTKCDMLNGSSTNPIKKDLPKKVDCVLISSVANQGLDKLKDAL